MALDLRRRLQSAPADPSGAVVAARRSEWVVGLRTGTRAVRSGALWGLVFGLYVAVQADAYVHTYPKASERLALAAGFGSGGLDAIFGRTREMQTVGGYTAWKSLGVLVVVGAIWGLAASTGALRGEEERGRWELLLAGPTTPGRAARQAVAGLFAGFAALLALTEVIVVTVGTSARISFPAGTSAFFAAAVVSSAAMFLAFGAVLSQLAPTRSRAMAWGAALLAVSFGIRSVGDLDTHLAWVLWVTPLGWVEELAPVTGSHFGGWAPIVASTVIAGAAAIHLAGRRDLDASIISDHASRSSHLFLLDGPTAVALRLSWARLAAWASGTVGFGLLLGGETHIAVNSLEASAAARRVLSRLAGSEVATDGYLSAALLLMAIAACLVGVSEVTAARREEALGRVDRFLVGPVTRTRWWAANALLAAGATIVVAGLGGASLWLGAAAHPLPVSAANMTEAILNTVPPAILVTGVALLAWALLPRGAAFIAYGWVAWSILVALLAGVTGISHWVLDTSALHQMVLAPARHPDRSSGLALTLLGVGAGAAGTVAFARRDLADE